MTVPTTHLGNKNTSGITPPTLLCDMYKLSHRQAYPKGTTKVYSTFTPRSNKYMPMADKAVVFGIQGFIKKYLIEYFNENFFNRLEGDVVYEYIEFRHHVCLEPINMIDDSHIRALHKLGYLPLDIRALDEGSLAPMQVPVLTVENTHPEFFWLTNFIETLMSTEIWLPMTSATFAYEMRKLLDKHAMKTVGHTNDVAWQGHDFSMRGMSSVESAMLSGAGHLLSFTGTGSIPSIYYLRKYYGADFTKMLVGGSIPATEHSVMTALTPTDSSRDEYEAYKELITETFPSGLVSLVSDSYDFWKVITETLPRLKSEIMARDGKVVIRPDSGNPIDILCGYEEPHYKAYINSNFYELEDGEEEMIVGEYNSQENLYDVLTDIGWDIWHDSKNSDRDEGSKAFVFTIKTLDGKFFKVYADITSFGYYEVTVPESWSFAIQSVDIEEAEQKGLIECLWETFGGTTTEKGYKVLDSHIGAIYGDSITYEVAKEICKRLEAKGFASTNVVLGIGSYSYQLRTRDSLGYAMKATYAEINGKPVMLQKDPKTDSGKKSQRGKVAVKVDSKGELYAEDGYSNSDEDNYILGVESMLKPVFLNGKLLKEQNLPEIRAKLNSK